MIKTAAQCYQEVRRIGFLPLGGDLGKSLFSLAERTDNQWHTGEDSDPWRWRMELAERPDIAYGKFFHGRAGFIDADTLPSFIAYRRRNMTLEELYERGLASRGAQRVYEALTPGNSLAYHELRQAVGLEKETELKRAVDELQTLLLLCVVGEKRKLSAKGEPYGWPVSVYSRVEDRFALPPPLDWERAKGELLGRACRAGAFPEKAALRLCGPCL